MSLFITLSRVHIPSIHPNPRGYSPASSPTWGLKYRISEVRTHNLEVAADFPSGTSSSTLNPFLQDHSRTSSTTGFRSYMLFATSMS